MLTLVEADGQPPDEGGLGGGDLGREKGTLSGRLDLIEPNCGMLARALAPRKRILSDCSIDVPDAVAVAVAGVGPSASSTSSSWAKWTRLDLGRRGSVLLIPILDVGDIGGDVGATTVELEALGDACGGFGAGRTGTALAAGNSMAFCGIGWDISRLRSDSRLILAALML